MFDRPTPPRPVAVRRATRGQSTGEEDHLAMSESTYALVKGLYECSVKKVHPKGKDPINAYIVALPQPPSSARKQQLALRVGGGGAGRGAGKRPGKSKGTSSLFSLLCVRLSHRRHA